MCPAFLWAMKDCSSLGFCSQPCVSSMEWCLPCAQLLHAAWDSLSCRPHPQVFSPVLSGKFGITQTPLTIAWFGVGITPAVCHWGRTGVNPHSWLVPRKMQGDTVLAGALPAPACLPTLRLLSESAHSAAGTLLPANSTEAPLFLGLRSGSGLCCRAVSALTQH